MKRRKAKTPSAMRVLCGELEDMSVWKDDVKIMLVRERLEPAVAEAEEREKMLLDALRAMETDQLVASNIETMKDVYFEGLRRARKALKDCDTVLAEATIDAAMSFHPMHAESWPGWLGEKAEDKS